MLCRRSIASMTGAGPSHLTEREGMPPFICPNNQTSLASSLLCAVGSQHIVELHRLIVLSICCHQYSGLSANSCGNCQERLCSEIQEAAEA